MKLVNSLSFTFLLVFAALAFSSCRQTNNYEKHITLYVGTYGDSLFKYSIDNKSFEYNKIESAAVCNSSYIALSDNGRYLFAVTESGDNSKISSFDNKNGLKFISSNENIAKDPCYISYFKEYLFTADYSGGSISVYPTDSGIINPASQVMQFCGQGPNIIRQASSHIHTVRILSDPEFTDNYLIATDLGDDKLYIFKIENSNGKMKCIPNNPYYIKTAPGSGPRHLEFDIARNQIYLLSELSGTISTYSYSEQSDNNLGLSLKQEILADSTDIQASADIHLHPDGKYLYSSHRKMNDRIAIMEIADNGTISIVGYQPTAGHPRNFVINKEGTLMFVASKDEQLIQIFTINPESGLLTDTGHTIDVESGYPVCILIE